jgi:hypothetical protein
VKNDKWERSAIDITEAVAKPAGLRFDYVSDPVVPITDRHPSPL